MNYEALETQILLNHAQAREAGKNPLPDRCIYYLVRSLYFTDAVILLPMRSPADSFAVSPDKQHVWHVDDPDKGPSSDQLDVVARSLRLYERHEDLEHPNVVQISTESRQTGVAATATGEDATIRRILFAPYTWLYSEGNKVVFRYGVGDLEVVPR